MSMISEASFMTSIWVRLIEQNLYRVCVLTCNLQPDVHSTSYVVKKHKHIWTKWYCLLCFWPTEDCIFNLELQFKDYSDMC